MINITSISFNESRTTLINLNFDIDRMNSPCDHKGGPIQEIYVQMKLREDTSVGKKNTDRHQDETHC